MRCVALVVTLLAVLPASAHAQSADWGVRRDPFDRTLIARYKALLAKNPHDRLALSALLSLYKRHRTVDLLVREYEETLAKTETASTLAVLGALARNRRDNDRALELFRRAVALDAKDSASWLAVAELHAGRGDAAEARVAFAKASETATTPLLEKQALRQLIAATRRERDAVAMEAAYDRLLELTPRDGSLWAERGDAQVEQGTFDSALASYKRAEELLRGDPERKLLAIASRAHVFDRAGKPDEAIAEYERAQAASPPGFYLRKDLTFRIIDVFRRHHSISVAIHYLDAAWPEKKRGAFEWGTLAELHKESADAVNMVRALHQAVEADPRDTGLQWKLIRHYDSAHEGAIAFSLLETAANASPGDALLSLELAQRLWTFEGRNSRRRALAIMRRLSGSAGRDVEAHRALAEIYARFGRPDLALREARVVAKLEPGDDNWALLGDALFAADRVSDAIVEWKKIGEPGTPAALQRLAEIYLDHQLWNDAVDAFTEAMFDDLQNPMLWRGRAFALAEMGRTTEARVDAQHAVTLLGHAHYEKGHEVRFRLVHLMRLAAIEDSGDETMEPDLWLMDLDSAFYGKKRDLQAGYLLAEYYRRRPDEKLARVLEELHERVSDDHGIVLELIRTYRGLEQFDRAIELATWLAAADPTRAQELAELTAAMERARPRVAARIEDERKQGELLALECLTCRAHAADALRADFGLRLGVGDSVRGRASGALTLGARLLVPLHDELALTTRVDWVRRPQPSSLMGAPEATATAVGASVGVAYPVVRGEHGTLLLGAAYRGEVRLGAAMERPGLDRFGFAADATLEYVPRGIPASLGMRFEQGLSEHGASSMLLLEATVELLDRR